MKYPLTILLLLSFFIYGFSQTEQNYLGPKNIGIIETSLGSALMVGGLGLISYGAYYKKNKFHIYDGIGNYQDKVNEYKKSYRNYFLFGSVSLSLGTILNALGISNFVKYNKNKSIGIGISDNNIGLKVNFN